MTKSFPFKSLLLLMLALTVACHTPKTVQKEKLPERTLNEIVVKPEGNNASDEGEISLEELEATDSMSEGENISDSEPKVYQESYKRVNDLIHTKLDVRFDWSKSYLLGKATITAKPHFYPTDNIVLDAKGFEIKNITFDGQNTPLKYDYDGKILNIQLGKTFKRNEEYKIFIDYIAKPDEGEVGGSEAISQDKGLYFINPKGDDIEKPQQIWTQGETESNSRWFPTIDKPNERMTNEIYITVEDKFKTLSNGILVNSAKNSDGTRTDYWKMDMPHAPYLVMMAVGDYAVVKDKWHGKDLMYYVEPKYADYAKDIFPNTPEMLDFFSTKLGVEYPWQKYAQVVVRDYVSGAMENTTAVIFGEFMNGTKRDLIDNLQNESVVAHEMFHHWFGDYVTCESWSNLTLNEGFANYSEYLWLEKKYGKDAADYHWLEESSGYFGSTQGGVHPLIHFGYTDRETMFDAHSYNKGGCVLHMLRNYIGDDAFFSALNLYLTRNKLTPVEAHQLRLAFEEVTGEDLNWFFNQWYFSAGHPTLEIEQQYDETAKMLHVNIKQIQDPIINQGIYKLPMGIDIYDANGNVRHEKITMTEREQSFSYEIAQKPALVNVDPEHVILAERQEFKTPEEYVFEYNHAPSFASRYGAIDALKSGYAKDNNAKMVFKKALNDSFWVIRATAIAAADIEDAEVIAKISAMATNDPHSNVRDQALARLAETQDTKLISVYKAVIDKEQAYPVISSALQSLYVLDEKEGLAAATKLENSENGSILSGVGSIYAQTGDTQYLSYFEKTVEKIDGYDVLAHLGAYNQLAKKGDDATLAACVEKMRTLGVNSAGAWKRYGALLALMGMKQEFNTRAEKGDDAHKTAMKAKADSIKTILKELAAKETNKQLRDIFDQLILMP